MLPIKIIRIDEHTNPIRDRNGFCIEAKAGEKGLLVGIIGKSTKTAFNGYANNAQASNKKIIEDLFKKGQRAFNSGFNYFLIQSMLSFQKFYLKIFNFISNLKVT